MELAALVSDLLRPGPSPPLKAIARLGSRLLVMSKLALDSSLFTLGDFELDSPLPMRSMTRLGSCLSALDLAHMDPSMSIHSSTRLEFMLLVIGLTCLGLVSSLPVTDCTNSGSPLLARSFARPGLAPLALDHPRPGFVLPLRSMAHSDFAVPVLDPLRPEPLPSPHSLGRPELAVFVLDLLRLGSTLSLRDAV